MKPRPNLRAVERVRDEHLARAREYQGRPESWHALAARHADCAQRLERLLRGPPLPDACPHCRGTCLHSWSVTDLRSCNHCGRQGGESCRATPRPLKPAHPSPGARPSSVRSTVMRPQRAPALKRGAWPSCATTRLSWCTKPAWSTRFPTGRCSLVGSSRAGVRRDHSHSRWRARARAARTAGQARRQVRGRARAGHRPRRRTDRGARDELRPACLRSAAGAPARFPRGDRGVTVCQARGWPGRQAARRTRHAGNRGVQALRACP